MAQNIVKTIVTNRPPKQPKFALEQLPEVKQTNRPPKSIKGVKEEKSRTRAGNIQMSINLKGKPRIIENGNKIK